MLDVFFQPAYAKLYEPTDGQCETFRFSCEYGDVQNTFLLRKIPNLLNGIQYYDILTPYGYGGPVILGSSDSEKLAAAYAEAFQSYCKEKNIVCEFIRFHLFDNTDMKGAYYGDVTYVLDDVIVDTTGTYEDIQHRYEHKVRKNVRKAVTNGLTILTEHGTEHLDRFLDIYYETMDRNHAKKYYYFSKEYFESVSSTLPENSLYFYVLKDGQVISTELILYSERYAYSFLGGTNEQFYEFRPNDFLKDEIIKWCNANGIEKFILGGGYSKEDGIYRYKRTFTSSPDVPFFVGKNIFNKEVYDALVEKHFADNPNADRESSFFPLYRAE